MWYSIEKGGDTLAKKRLAVTVEDYILERLIEEAQSQNRNLSNYVETLLIKALADEEDE